MYPDCIQVQLDPGSRSKSLGNGLSPSLVPAFLCVGFTPGQPVSSRRHRWSPAASGFHRTSSEHPAEGGFLFLSGLLQGQGVECRRMCLVPCARRGRGDRLPTLHGVGRECRASAVPEPRGPRGGRWRCWIGAPWEDAGAVPRGRKNGCLRPNPQRSTTATARGQTHSPGRSPGLGPQFPGVESRFHHRVTTSPVSLSLSVPI